MILAGNWHSNVHEEPMSHAMRELGWQIHSFKWFKYFSKVDSRNNIDSIITKIQRRLLLGPIVNKLNDDLVNLAFKTQADVIFVYRGDIIGRNTLVKIKGVSPRSILIGYNNDDPFSPHYPFWFWRHFKRSIPEYDLILAYRHSNVSEFKSAGAKRVKLLRSWFIPKHHYPISKEAINKLNDVVFIGHYEDDNRLSILEAIVRNGFSLALYGHGSQWNTQIKNSPYLKSYIPVKTVWGNQYNKVLNQSRIALCFLSGLNRDTYTRRCFEIPASGTLLLAEYTEDLASLFVENEEAVFFSSEQDLIKKLKWLIADQSMCKFIANNGQKKVRDAGHDVVSRMKMLEKWIDEVRIEHIN